MWWSMAPRRDLARIFRPSPNFTSDYYVVDLSVLKKDPGCISVVHGRGIFTDRGYHLTNPLIAGHDVNQELATSRWIDIYKKRNYGDFIHFVGRFHLQASRLNPIEVNDRWLTLRAGIIWVPDRKEEQSSFIEGSPFSPKLIQGDLEFYLGFSKPPFFPPNKHKITQNFA